MGRRKEPILPFITFYSHFHIFFSNPISYPLAQSWRRKYTLKLVEETTYNAPFKIVILTFKLWTITAENVSQRLLEKSALKMSGDNGLYNICKYLYPLWSSFQIRSEIWNINEMNGSFINPNETVTFKALYFISC